MDAYNATVSWDFYIYTTPYQSLARRLFHCSVTHLRSYTKSASSPIIHEIPPTPRSLLCTGIHALLFSLRLRLVGTTSHII
jgi:hypothetical protein